MGNNLTITYIYIKFDININCSTFVSMNKLGKKMIRKSEYIPEVLETREIILVVVYIDLNLCVYPHGIDRPYIKNPPFLFLFAKVGGFY